MLLGSKKHKDSQPVPSFKVNLFIHKGEEPPIYTKLIKWALSSGRFIVVVVELIVIGAFVYRYKLDADLVNLQERIKEQIPYIKTLTENETLIRKAQFKLSSVKKVRTGTPKYSEILAKVALVTPKSIQLNNITFSLGDDTNSSKVMLTISGRTPSNLEVSAFIQALKKMSELTEVSLSNISFDEQTTFTITATLAQVVGNPQTQGETQQ